MKIPSQKTHLGILTEMSTVFDHIPAKHLISIKPVTADCGACHLVLQPASVVRDPAELDNLVTSLVMSMSIL